MHRAWLLDRQGIAKPRNSTQNQDLEEVDNVLGAAASGVSADDGGSFKDFLNLLSNAELDECLRLILPIIKLEPGKYLIGTKA